MSPSCVSKVHCQSFGDAVIELSKASLIQRMSISKAISVHRLVQSAVFNRLAAEEQTNLLDSSICLLIGAFPNTWQEGGHSQGRSWQAWETCSAVLPHISHIMIIATQNRLRATDDEAFAELLFRARTYLWGKEQPTLANVFLEYGLSLDIDPDGPSAAQVYRLLGHVALDMAQPRAALST